MAGNGVVAKLGGKQLPISYAFVLEMEKYGHNLITSVTDATGTVQYTVPTLILVFHSSTIFLTYRSKIVEL